MSIDAGRKARGRPKTGGTGVEVRLSPELRLAIDAWIAVAAEPGDVTHAEALRRLATLALRQLGHLP